MRKRAAHADHGHGPWGFPGALRNVHTGRNFLTNDTRRPRRRKAQRGEARERGASHERELRRIVDTFFVWRKSTEPTNKSTWISCGLVTRFANNAIHRTSPSMG